MTPQEPQAVDADTAAHGRRRRRHADQAGCLSRLPVTRTPKAGNFPGSLSSSCHTDMPVNASLQVQADDDGILEVQLQVANLSRKALTIKAFHCEQWFWNDVELPSMEPHFRGIGTRLRKHSFADCLLTFQLGSGAVRRLHGATRAAPNTFSSVEARVEIFGRLWFERRKEPLWLYLTPPNAMVSTPWR